MIGPEDPKGHVTQKYVNSIVGRFSNRIPVGTHAIERKGIKGEVVAYLNGMSLSITHTKNQLTILQRVMRSLCMVAQSDGMLFPGRSPRLPSSSLRLKKRKSKLFRKALLLFSTSGPLLGIKVSLEL